MEDFTMLTQENPAVNKAVGVLMELNASQRRRMIAESREKARRDYQARFDGAYEKGLALGEEKGLMLGEKKGLALGEKKGEAYGWEKAVALMEQGYTVQEMKEMHSR
jgi:hypothetical protein